MITAEARCESRFFFLPGKRGQLFATLRSPLAEEDCTGAVLCVMPLAEEMNRCRRLVALQACALAQRGQAVLCIDYYGCGDSEGEFADADWQTWVDDLKLARDWLETESGHTADIWAIRHGALLAAAAFRDVSPRLFLLWQPVVSGAAALSEILRVSVASSMLRGSNRRATVDALKAAVLGGDAVEVGGYVLSPELACALDDASLDPWPFTGSNVEWMDIVPEDGDVISSRGAPALVPLGAPADEIRNHRVPGRRFWSAPDVFECASLISETVKVFSERANPG